MLQRRKQSAEDYLHLKLMRWNNNDFLQPIIHCIHSAWHEKFCNRLSKKVLCTVFRLKLIRTSSCVRRSNVFSSRKGSQSHSWRRLRVERWKKEFDQLSSRPKHHQSPSSSPRTQRSYAITLHCYRMCLMQHNIHPLISVYFTVTIY